MSGSSASRRSAQRLLVALQVMLIVATLFSPIPAAAADDPPADPPPSTEPTPTPTPEATPEPTPEAAPEPTPEPTPEATPEATPEPSPAPTPDPALATEPWIVTFVAGVAADDKDALLGAVGAVQTGSIPQLRMRTILLDPSTDADSAAALRADARVARVDADRLRVAEEVPTDPSYDAQWALPRIEWEAARDTYTASGTAVVAVLDTGVDASHPDLDDAIVTGASILDGSTWSSDPNGHGTAMAGIVAAETNNAEGIAGVGYAGVKVMPVTVLAADGTGQDSDVIAGVVWAADNGADVILMAFSSGSYSASLQAAVDYAWSSGVVLVAAAGNDGSSAGSFPAGDRGVIGVSNTSETDSLAAGSNFGASVFLGAPGVGIYTTDAGGDYRFISGTSASAAIVAGAAAELIAVDPSASNGIVVGRLARNADPAGTAEETGNGRVNLARALGDTSTDPVQPAGSPPVGISGPFVGPYVLAANNDAHVAPGWAATNTTVTFSTLYRKTTGGTVQHVRITLPVGYTNISVAATAFSSGTWSTPVVNQIARTVDVQLTAGTGLATNNVSWARIDVTATTPLANQTLNAAEWFMQTFTNTAGTTGEQNDNPPVLIGVLTDPSATITFVDGGGNPITDPVLQNGVAATVRVRINSQSTSTTIKYTDIAIPTCFSSPSGVATSNPSGNPYNAPIVTDGFIRLGGGSIALNGSLTVTFTTTPNCVSGTYLVSSDPSTNATNPPSGTNQSVSTTGGSLTVAAGLADLSITKTDSPDPVMVGGTLTYTIGVSNAGPDDANAVKVVDTLPSGTTFVSASGTNWNCVHVSGTVTCNRTGGNLAPGAAPNITIVVLAPATAGSITNSATVSSPNDNTPGNNTATATTNVVNQADLSITKTDGVISVTAGDSVTYTYTITVTNNGPSTAAAVTFTDTWPTGFSRGTLPAGCVNVGAGPDFTCALGAILNGASVTRTITYTVPADTTASPQVNSVTVSSATDDPNTANNTATDSNTVSTSANLSVTKSDGVTSVTAGDGVTYTYTITVSNAGPSNATGVSLSDTWPAGFTRGAVTHSQGTCTGSPSFSCSLGTITSGGSATVAVTYTVPADTTGSQTNTATASSAVADPNAANNTGSDTNTVTTSADLALTKDDGESSVTAGTSTSYTIELTNHGPSSVPAGVVVSDPIPAGTTGSTSDSRCSISGGVLTCTTTAALAPGASTSFDLTLAVDPDYPGSTLSNTATISSSPVGDGNPANDSSTDTDTVNREADLSITKSGPATAIAGDPAGFDYTLAVTNNGPSAQSGGFSVSDSLPAGTTFQTAGSSAGCSAAGQLVTCTSASGLALGASLSFTVHVTVGADVPAGTDLANNASVASNGTSDGNPANNTSNTTHTTVNTSADLELTKDDGESSVTAGTSTSYTIELTNHGPSSVPAGVVVSDPIPAGTTGSTSDSRCSISGGVLTCTTTAALAPGASTSFDLTLAVHPDYPGSTLSNTATISGSPVGDPNPANDSATDTDTVNREADLALTKDDGESSVTAGTSTSYTIGLLNIGPSSVPAGIVVSDPIPAGTTGSTTDSRCSISGGVLTCTTTAALAPGASTSFDLTLAVDPDYPGSTLSNTATISSSPVGDPNPANDSATDTDTVNREANLELSKDDDPDPVIAGETLTYTITVSNAGPSDAADATVSDSLPTELTDVTVSSSQGGCTAFPCNLGTVAAADSATITVSATVAASTSGSAVLSNTATVTSSTTDPITTNNSDTETTDVDREADLEITKTDEWTANDHDPVTAGATGAYQLTVTNHGPSASSGFAATDTLPTGFTFNATGSDLDCSSGAGNTVVCTRTGDLAVGSSTTFVIAYDANPAITNNTVVTNSAAVDGADTDPVSDNDTDTEQTTVVSEADLVVDKEDDPDPVVAGTALTYTITVTNDGPSDNAGFTLSDTLPSETSYLSDDSGACEHAGGVVTCTVSNLADGATFTVDVVVGVASSVPDGTVLNNTAEITSSNTPDPDADNDTADEGTAVVAEADLLVNKDDGVASVTAGDDVTYAYTITVNNAGPSDATLVELSDDWPDGFTRGALPANCADAVSAPDFTCDLGSIPAGGSAIVSISYTVPSSTTGDQTNSAAASTDDTDTNPANNSDDDTNTVLTSADLSLDKTDDPEPVIAGTELTYTISVANAGPSDNAGFTVTDALPPGTSYVSASAGCAEVAGTVTCTSAGLDYGATETWDIVVAVSSSVPGGASLTNTAAIGTSDTTDPDLSNNADTETTAVQAQANLSVSKTDGQDSVTAGDEVTYIYLITITNAGPSDATGVILDDTWPTGFTRGDVTPSQGSCADSGGGPDFSCDLGTIGSGEAATVTVTYTVPANTPAGPQTNTVSMTSDTPDPAPGDESASDTTDVETSADLTITKDDSPDQVTAGEDLTYILTVTNHGPSDAQDVVVTDTLPAELGGAQYCTYTSPDTDCTPSAAWTGSVSLGVIAAGQTVTVVIRATVASSTSGGAVITNTASVDSATDDPDRANNSDIETTSVVRLANLADLKVDTPDPVVAGETIFYTITVTNDGPSDADNVSVVDTLPTGTSNARYCVVSGTVPCTAEAEFSPYVSGTPIALGTLAADASRTVKIRVDVDPDAADGSTLTNTAVVSSTDTDPDPDNNTTTADTQVTTLADLSVSKSDTPDPVTAGATLTYTITVANAGPSDNAGFTLTDVLPAGTTYVSDNSPVCEHADGTVTCTVASGLAAHDTFTVNIVVLVASSVPDGTELSNTAGITANQTDDPDPTDDTDTETTTVTASADLSVNKTDGVASVTAGDGVTYTYTITVSNAGPSDATGVALTDDWPAGFTRGALPANCTNTNGGPDFSCSLGTITAGDSATVSVSYTVPSSTIGSQTNDVAVSATTADQVEANDMASDTNTVVTSADLALTKSDSPDPATAGSNLTYTITVTNLGPSDNAGFTVTDALPAGTTFVSATAGCNHAGGTVTCISSGLARGASVTWQIVVQVSSTVAHGAVLSNTATISTNQTSDPNPSNNSDTETTTVQRRAVFLVIDEDSIDNGNAPNNFSASNVNDDIAKLALRTQLRYFQANPGQVLTLYTGHVGDEGWFALKTIPSSWASAGPTPDGLRNFVGDPSQPYPHGVGPGLGTGNDPEKLLDKVPNVTPLRAEGQKMLEGKTICAVVYDSDISINYGPLNGSLKGANLGTVAFEVISVTRLTGASSSSLPKVQIRIVDARQFCGGPLELYLTAPTPSSSSQPFDVVPGGAG